MPKTIADKVNYPSAAKYVLAISGGVDSMSLLDIMAKTAKKRRYLLIVAHFDHGMRRDSAEDRLFVKTLSHKYGLRFITKQAKLGKSSEDVARQARYRWLEQVQTQTKAAAIITAHHLDDALETAVFNVGRGAERWGMTPMQLHQKIIRPLLDLTKAELIKYAWVQKLDWREDPTNQDLQIVRNFIRHRTLPLLHRGWLTKDLQRLARLNQRELEKSQAILNRLAEVKPSSIKFRRYDLIMLENRQLADILRLAAAGLGSQLDGKHLRRLALFAKTAGKSSLNLTNQLRAESDNDILRLVKNQLAH